MGRKILGTVVTNANGESTFIYKSKGLGKLNIIAEGGDFVSAPKQIIDATYYDKGINEKKNDKWFNQSSAFSLTRNNSGTTLSTASTTEKYFLAGEAESITDTYLYSKKVCIEVTILEDPSEEQKLCIKPSEGNDITFAIDKAGKYLFYYDGEKIHTEKTVINSETGLEQTTKNEVEKSLTDKVAVGFKCTNGSLKYKDFVVYPY